MKYVLALLVVLFGLAVSFGLCVIFSCTAWYGFELRGGAMFAWVLVTAVISAGPTLAAQMCANDIIAGR